LSASCAPDQKDRPGVEIVNGYVCQTCCDADLAKRGVDPAHPKDDPQNPAYDPAKAAADHGNAVVFGGALKGLNKGVGAQASGASASSGVGSAASAGSASGSSPASGLGSSPIVADGVVAQRPPAHSGSLLDISA
jgi:hypothetical protein